MRTLGRVKQKYSRKKTTQYFYSHKSGAHLWVEGTSEVDTALILEFDDNTLTYNEQNYTFVLRDLDGNTFSYTPDFISVELSVYDHVVIEAKTDCYQMSEEDIALLRWAFETQHNKKFVHIVPTQLCSPERLENYRKLYPYMRMCPTQKLPLTTAKILCGDALTFSDFRSALLKHHIDDSYAFAYLAHRFAKFDFDIPLTDETIVEFI